jgi:hypothetical protein
LTILGELEEVFISEGNKEELLHTIAKPYNDSLITAEEVAPL